MPTKVTIMLIVLGAEILSLGILAMPMVVLGPWLGLGVGAGIERRHRG